MAAVKVCFRTRRHRSCLSVPTSPIDSRRTGPPSTRTPERGSRTGKRVAGRVKRGQAKPDPGPGGLGGILNHPPSGRPPGRRDHRTGAPRAGPGACNTDYPRGTRFPLGDAGRTSTARVDNAVERLGPLFSSCFISTISRRVIRESTTAGAWWKGGSGRDAGSTRRRSLGTGVFSPGGLVSIHPGAPAVLTFRTVLRPGRGNVAGRRQTAACRLHPNLA